jgi:hypothetical protein
MNKKKQQKIPDSIYRLGHSDKFACKNCSLKDDKWGIIRHVEYCKGSRKVNQNNLGGENIK